MFNVSGDTKFGIDMTSSEYKETKGVKDILSEQQRKRREKEVADKKSKKHAKNNTSAEREEEVQSVVSNAKDTDSLVNKLKRKFGGASK